MMENNSQEDGQFSTVQVPTRFSEWPQQGQYSAYWHLSLTIRCVPMYLPDILLALSYDWPRQSDISIPFFFKKEKIISAISAPLWPLIGMKEGNR